MVGVRGKGDARVLVRVVFLAQSSVGGFDLLVARLLADAEELGGC